jgi:GT2 family glycosyltransferase
MGSNDVTGHCHFRQEVHIPVLPEAASVEGQAATSGTLVSFVIIAYNEAANISHAIAAITQLEDLGEYEIIVVDDGSCDSTARIVSGISQKNTNVRLIKLQQNRGRGYARNAGIGAVRGDLIAMIDGDIVLPSNWLIRARSALADHDAVGGTAVPDGDVAYIYKRFRLCPRIVPGTATVTGNNGLYRRHVFEVAGFDPALREGEDVALNYAIRQHGLSAMTVPGLLVEHREDKTMRTSLKWLFESGRGATRQLLDYHELRQPDLVTGAFVGTTALGIVFWTHRHRLIGAAIPACFILAASMQHVRTRFETPPAHWPRVASAVSVDSALLTAYFVGRLAGITALRRKLYPARSRPGRHARAQNPGKPEALS